MNKIFEIIYSCFFFTWICISAATICISGCLPLAGCRQQAGCIRQNSCQVLIQVVTKSNTEIQIQRVRAQTKLRMSSYKWWQKQIQKHLRDKYKNKRAQSKFAGCKQVAYARILARSSYKWWQNQIQKHLKGKYKNKKAKKQHFELSEF